jgi:hypothetical protein
MVDIRGDFSMRDRLGIMFDLEIAPGKLSSGDLYSVGLDFFSALGYSVDSITICKKETMFSFLYADSEKYRLFTADEKESIRCVDSVSWLFSVKDRESGRSANSFCA